MHTNTEHTSHSSSAASAAEPLSGGFVTLDGAPAYRISGYHRLDPFLVNLASDTDLWMFIASSGGLTAGRVDAEASLFPYLTSDRLYDAHHHTGPVTLLCIERASGARGAPVSGGDGTIDPSAPTQFWEPFADDAARRPGVGRNLYKNTSGTQIVFEEVAPDLGLAFRYRWAGCDEFGWVRTAALENRGKARLRVTILDGLRNVLPWGAPLALHQQASNLVDAYKTSELDPASGIGIFSLTAGITDRPEALEVLRANTVWCCGLEDFGVHLGGEAIGAFRRGQPLPERRVLNGRRGNFLVRAAVSLDPGEVARWHLVADVGRNQIQIEELRRSVRRRGELFARVEASLHAADENLRRIVASADGLQRTGSPESAHHQFANVLFNTMRGGVFWRNADVPLADFARLLETRNREAAKRCRTLLADWPESVPVGRLRAVALENGDADLARLAHEYLPLYFGRRHGDPSRPWNRFEIRVRDSNGDRVLHHEGNWRDIFQNWEALGASFPSFLPGMVARFVGASTVDGNNPYRITQDGIDWEVPAPNDPWSNIGYWGDHQIIYLLRLLEAMERYDPSILRELLVAEIFSYADVPYRIKPYEEILQDPRATIDFDREHAARIDARVDALGTDGKLLPGSEGGTYHANLFEKLLVPALSKLSNLVPGGGIWMNTQRPEWNDANNALAGDGVSVVTLCHLRRYLAFLAERLEAIPPQRIPVSTEIITWFDRVARILSEERMGSAPDGSDPLDRKRIMDALGGAFSEYRAAVYARGFSDRTNLATHRVAAFCRTALARVDASIAANRRDDGLYHAYNRLVFSPDRSRVELTRLPEMLEGQVAALGSGAIPPPEALQILERLFASALYRPDQGSFMLYPARELPGFMNRNMIPEEGLAAIPLLRELESRGDRSLWARDAAGVARFHGDLRSVRDVAGALDRLAQEPHWSAPVARDRAAILALFEETFGHQFYTGRSAAMYGYEGIGCIYWHMVAKLLLATGEVLAEAERADESRPVREALARMYRRVQSGLGYRKTVAEYGAFPTDPYSHTPPAGGARQPGMTGQVKEEILARLYELGVCVEEGALQFRPRLLAAGEFLEHPTELQYFDLTGRARTLALPAGSLAFTFCQVPVVYERIDGGPWIRVTLADGSSHELTGYVLAAEWAAKVFARGGEIEQIRVGIPTDALLLS
ncbi:MAG: hypothetical protein GF330_06690 [Candidatus Eisenbacteria bacterium]|nr:hypothetical protein [Candidatus Eisenbacteria bacterium]